MPGNDPIEDTIAKAEARLAALEAEAGALREHLRDLHAPTSTGQVPTPAVPQPAAHVPSTTADKVALFRSLFRGREDVFPTLWIDRRTGRKGYSPRCVNRWQPGLCSPKTVRCNTCPHRSYVPVSDRVVLDHLQGRHVIGVYPLLPDESCHLLAADFDKDCWVDDVTAFRGTCQAFGIPVAIERSRSGNGAHAWFFFTAPVPARSARQMGCFLLTETMERRPQLGLASYDRLFPNQDTMPRGGLGNLIALPLQHEARKSGNTMFLDEALVPLADQWAALAAIERIAPDRVEAIAAEARRQHRVLAVRHVPMEDDGPAPWTRKPSRRQASLPIAEPVPAEVRATLAQRLFVSRTGLPASLVGRIRRLAAFQNPEFYSRQAMRLSTARTPRVITCAEEHAEHVALPRGCLEDLQDLLREHGGALHLDDQRHGGDPLGLAFQGHLTPTQEAAAQVMLQHDTGILVAPPGMGKTVIGAFLVAARNCSTLVLVHRKPLLEQWVAQLASLLGVDPKSIGTLGGGRRKPSGRIDVAMVQSLVRRNVVDDLVARYGLVIVDECHHVPAVSVERVLAEVRARFVIGLTATPWRRDGHQPILHMQCGPTRFVVDPRSLEAQAGLAHHIVVRETGFVVDGLEASAGIQDLYSAMAADGPRNDLIVEDVTSAIAEGRSPVVITERRDHLDLLAARLEHLAEVVVKLHGDMGTFERRAARKHLAQAGPRTSRLVLATGRYLGEGFDDARLDTLFLAMPVAWKGTIVQYAGRLHRRHPGKSEVRVYDYVDRNVPVLARMFEKRLKGYRTIGYEVHDDLFAFRLDAEGPYSDGTDELA